MKDGLLRMVGIMILGCGIAGVGGCHKKVAESHGRPPSPVRVAVAREATVPVLTESFGRLRAVSDVNIQAQVTGMIVDAPFVEGATVKKGDVLFRIEQDSYQAAVDQAAAQIRGAEADLAQKQATLDRNGELLAQNLISQDDYDRLKTSVEAAQATLEQARAALESAKVNLVHCEIISPVDGVTGKRLVDVGNLVAAGAGQTLVNVRDIRTLFLDFTLSEAHVPAVRSAMEAGTVELLVAAEAPEGEPNLHRGELRVMDNTVNPGSGTISLRAVVDNEQGKLWPGQFVYAYPVLQTIEKTVIVPSEAVNIGKDGPFVYVVKDGQANLQPVTKGPEVMQATVLLKGVSAGDSVVIQGQLGIWPGAKVAASDELDEASRAVIERRKADPNAHALAAVLSARGDTSEQISIFLGLPAAEVDQLLSK